MSDILQALRLALELLIAPDPALLRVVALSLAVSLSATVIAALIGLPLAAALAACAFPGRRAIIVTSNALLGLPPVVVGLVLYLLLSRSGPLGAAGLLFTPAAMVIAQTLLALPIITAIAHAAFELLWQRFGPALRVFGASPRRAIPHLLAMGRTQALTAVLAGFGRCLAEVGAIIVVGGNIAGHTRTMTTTIVFETGRGNFPFALALGMVLIAISLAVSAAAFGLRRRPAAPEEERS